MLSPSFICLISFIIYSLSPYIANPDMLSILDFFSSREHFEWTLIMYLVIAVGMNPHSVVLASDAAAINTVIKFADLTNVWIERNSV